MKKTGPAIVSVCVCLILVSSVPLISTQVVAAPAPKPIKIGMIMAYTGFGAIGDWWELGARLAIDDAGGQIAGRPIELILEDDASDANVALEKARKFVEKDNVDVIIGGVMTSAGCAAYAKESGTPFIFTMGSKREETLRGGRNCVNPTGTNRGTSYPEGLYAYDVMGVRTVTVIHDDFSGPYDSLEGALTAFKRRGGKVIQYQVTPIQTVDYAPNIATMKEADAVFFFFIPFNALRFVSQYFKAGRKMPLVSITTPTLNELDLPQIGDSAIGMIAASPLACGIDIPQMKAFIDRWVKKYGNLPQKEYRYPRLHEAIYAYVAVQIYLEAAKITRGDTTFNLVGDTLRKIRVETPGGLVSFTPEGIGIGDNYILQVVKEGDRLYWKDIRTYSQIVRDVPPE